MSRCSLAVVLIPTLIALGLSEQVCASPWRFWGAVGFRRATNQYVPGGGVSCSDGSLRFAFAARLHHI
jgi:hypothetical protein